MNSFSCRNAHHAHHTGIPSPPEFLFSVIPANLYWYSSFFSEESDRQVLLPGLLPFDSLELLQRRRAKVRVKNRSHRSKPRGISSGPSPQEFHNSGRLHSPSASQLHLFRVGLSGSWRHPWIRRPTRITCTSGPFEVLKTGQPQHQFSVRLLIDCRPSFRLCTFRGTCRD